VNQFLELLSSQNISCTFFILGWVAQKNPFLVRKIKSFGHEIASHGNCHELIYEIGPEKFREDIRTSKNILEDLIDDEVQGYRGPGFSITRENAWAFDIIAEEGFQYDATLFPGGHGHGGIAGLPCQPFNLVTMGSQQIEEYPVTVLNIAGYRFAFSGGGYFRLFPLVFISYCIKLFNGRGIPVMSYIHPRDFDPDAPLLPMSWKRKLKSYVNIAHSFDKLKKLLNTHYFGSIQDWRNSQDGNLPVFSLKDYLLK